MSEILVEFWVETLAGIVGVFVGVWLALITERRRQSRQDARKERERQQQYARARHTVLGSVVKNSNEAGRLGIQFEKRQPFELIHTQLEVSVWEAVQTQFMQACHDIDERVRFAQFFDGVRNLQKFLDFHRGLQLSIAGAFDDDDPELGEIMSGADQHLQDLVEDQRFNGVLLITDFGEPVHKKLMGIKA